MFLSFGHQRRFLRCVGSIHLVGIKAKVKEHHTQQKASNDHPMPCISTNWGSHRINTSIKPNSESPGSTLGSLYPSPLNPPPISRPLRRRTDSYHGRPSSRSRPRQLLFRHIQLLRGLRMPHASTLGTDPNPPKHAHATRHYVWPPPTTS